jgi:hypothetical protein
VLCELEWMRTRVLVQLSCVELSTGRMSDGVAEASPVLVERVRDAVAEVEALVMSFGQRLASLPARGVLATGDEVAAAAAAALEEGIVAARAARLETFRAAGRPPPIGPRPLIPEAASAGRDRGTTRAPARRQGGHFLPW